MLKKAEIKKILKKNPHIHAKELEESIILSEELKKIGIQSRGYQLAPPYVRRFVRVDSGDENDHRTINLSESRH